MLRLHCVRHGSVWNSVADGTPSQESLEPFVQDGVFVEHIVARTSGLHSPALTVRQSVAEVKPKGASDSKLVRPFWSLISDKMHDDPCSEPFLTSALLAA